MYIQSVSAAAMEKAASALWEKQQLITTNIANEDTPGYKAKRMEFSSLLRGELQAVRRSGRREAAERISRIEPKIYEDNSTVGRADGNNVDLNAENIEFSRVQMQYQMLTQQISNHYTTLKYAISGGR